MKSIKINENLWLCQQPVEKSEEISVPKQTNHIFVVDVSGSMYHDLQLIRKQLKNKLPSLMKDGDTISIIWFSGDNQAGVLMEEVEIRSLTTFTHINDAIDRWLKPIGLTAFNKPLELTSDLIDKIEQNRPNGVFSLIFLTDGYNNDCSYTDVRETLKSLTPKLSSSVFVEYGFYADSQRLTDMASIVGGEKISCDNFEDFDPVFSEKIGQDILGSKKIIVELEAQEIKHDFAYAIKNDGGIMIYGVEYEYGIPSIMVSNDIHEVYFLSTKTQIFNESFDDKTALYAGIYVLSDKILNDDAELLLGYLGDKYYYQQFANSFGKQKLNQFKNNIKTAVTDESKQFIEGYDSSIKIDQNAYCLMYLIEDLYNIKDCLFYPKHPKFNYNRIGRKKLQVGSKLTEKEKKELNETNNLDELTEKVNKLKETKVDLEFAPFNENRGFPIQDLVWNETRPNLSIRVKYDGEVELPENNYDLDRITTFMYRTYTIVKDGIVNIDQLPVSYSRELINVLDKNNVDYEIYIDTNNVIPSAVLINIESLPIINLQMVKSLSAKNLGFLEWELLKNKAVKKAVDYFRKQYFPKESQSFAKLVGVDAAQWLKGIGITDYNGFAPKTEYAPSTDSYMSINLETKIKGYSTLPKVTDVIKKLENNKPLKPTEELMSTHIKNILETKKEYGETSEEFENLLISSSIYYNEEKKKIQQQISGIKFALILSKKWFEEFKTFDEDTINLKINNKGIQISFKLIEKEEKI
ncbi:MAG: VWA domain-containing protein [bacterium]